jgi:hypothetical protein
MTIANWRNPKIRRLAGTQEVRRNVSLSPAEVSTELSRNAPQPEIGPFDETASLKQAIIMVYQFHFKEAGLNSRTSFVLTDIIISHGYGIQELSERPRAS